MRYIGKTILLGSLALLAACNPMAELDDADKAVAKFHAELNAGDINGIWQRAHADFRGGQPKVEYDGFMQAVRTRLGAVKSSERQGFNIATNNGATTVALSMATKFESEDAMEQFVFRREGEGLLLYNYVVNSRRLVTGPPPDGSEPVVQVMAPTQTSS